jgi:hypothetical protein
MMSEIRFLLENRHASLLDKGRVISLPIACVSSMRR